MLDSKQRQGQIFDEFLEQIYKIMRSNLKRLKLELEGNLEF